MKFSILQFILLFLLFAVSAIGRTVLPAPEPLASQFAEITETAQQQTCSPALGNLILEKKRNNTVIVRVYDGNTSTDSRTWQLDKVGNRIAGSVRTYLFEVEVSAT